MVDWLDQALEEYWVGCLVLMSVGSSVDKSAFQKVDKTAVNLVGTKELSLVATLEEKKEHQLVDSSADW